MEEKGGAVYAGSYEGWNKEVINRISDMDIERMSRAGMNSFDTKAVERIFSIIRQEMQK